MFNYNNDIETIINHPYKNIILNRHPIFRLLLSIKFPDKIRPHEKYTYMVFHPQDNTIDNRTDKVRYLLSIIESTKTKKNKIYIVIELMDYISRYIIMADGMTLLIKSIKKKFTHDFDSSDKSAINSQLLELNIDDIENPYEHWCKLNFKEINDS